LYLKLVEGSMVLTNELAIKVALLLSVRVDSATSYSFWPRGTRNLVVCPDLLEIILQPDCSLNLNLCCPEPIQAICSRVHREQEGFASSHLIFI
jgi:hypothetical protein